MESECVVMNHEVCAVASRHYAGILAAWPLQLVRNGRVRASSSLFSKVILVPGS
jgi:hypothetical protein